MIQRFKKAEGCIRKVEIGIKLISSKLLFNFHSELHIFASLRPFPKQPFSFIASVRQAILFNYSYQAENLAKPFLNFQLYIFQVNCFPTLGM